MAVLPLPPVAGTRLTRRRRAPAVAAALAIVGALCLGLASRAEPETARAAITTPSAAPLTTPLWSPRRAPELLDSTEAAASLQRQLASVISPFESCAVVADAGGAVARVDPNRALAGASTQKLLVGAASLAVLGPQHRFETRAVADAPLQSGVLQGDLTIVGGGDPMLASSDVASTPTAPTTPLPQLADAIVRAGVHRIDGALVADDSRYDRERAVPDWKPNEVTEGDVGALGALIVDGGRADDGIAAPDPALATVQQLATLLSARGVQIAHGATDPGHAAAGSQRELAHIDSPPLAQIVEQMLTVSNDETAELLTRELGVVRAHAGTTAAGTRVIPEVLAGLGVPVGGVELHDGSGLAPDDRVTCAALQGVVALGSQPKFGAILDGLAVAGESGTLAGRLVGTDLVGRLRAKTGHIDGVVGLAGVIDPANAAEKPQVNAPEVRFAFIANGGFSTTVGETMQDQIAEAIGTYVDAPAAPDPVPAPR